MSAIRNCLLFAFTAATLAAVTGCTESAPDSDATPPPAQTADQIQEQQSEEERAAEQAAKAEREKERRIQRNRNAVNDLMFLGMTVAEANEALGVDGTMTASIGGENKEQESYEWKLEGDVVIRATFVNGKLDKKEMAE